MIQPSFKLEQTSDKLTSQAGLLVPCQLMDSLDITGRADRCLPDPGSNRDHRVFDYLQTFMLMFHSGRCHLDDVRQLPVDELEVG